MNKMKKLVVQCIDNNNYMLVDEYNNVYIKNIEFYTEVKPKVNDIMYLADRVVDRISLYAFGEIYDTKNYRVDDFMKLVSNGKEYYYQELFG